MKEGDGARGKEMESWRGMKGDRSQRGAGEEKPLNDGEREAEKKNRRRSDSDHHRAER